MTRMFSPSAHKFEQIEVGDTFKPDKIYTELVQRDIPQYYALNELPMIMLENGLGTAATRDGIISTLIKRFYIELRQNGNLTFVVITAKGLALLNTLPDEFKTPAIRAKWERMLDIIEQTEDLEQARKLRNEFISRSYDQVQYLCRLFNSGQLVNYTKDTTPASDELLKQVINRANMLNIEIDPNDYGLKRVCHNFLLANPMPYHSKQKYQLQKSGVTLTEHTLRDSNSVGCQMSQNQKTVPPLASQLALAAKLAHLVNIKFPDSARKTSAKCSEFIELCESKRQPSPQQVRTLKQLALENHYVIPPQALLSRKQTKQLIWDLRKLKKERMHK